jgi:hypothetical protein
MYVCGCGLKALLTIQYFRIEEAGECTQPFLAWIHEFCKVQMCMYHSKPTLHIMTWLLKLHCYQCKVCECTYHSVPGKPPLPGKRPCTTYRGLNVAASVQMYAIYIPGKRPCRPKLCISVTRDTMVHVLIEHILIQICIWPILKLGMILYNVPLSSLFLLHVCTVLLLAPL